MSPSSETSAPTASREEGKLPKVWPWQKAWWTRDHLTGVAWAAVVFIVLTVVGMLVQNTAQATGLFGPSLEELISNQQTNFDEVRSTLEALRNTKDPAEQERLRKELELLIARQEALTQRTHVELREYQGEAERARAELLAKKGSAGGADFWIGLNGSATVGSREHVVAVTGITGNNTYIQVNYQNDKRYMYPGDVLEIETPEGKGKVIFKQAKDGRAGFDWVPPGEMVAGA